MVRQFASPLVVAGLVLLVAVSAVQGGQFTVGPPTVSLCESKDGTVVAYLSKYVQSYEKGVDTSISGWGLRLTGPGMKPVPISVYTFLTDRAGSASCDGDLACLIKISSDPIPPEARAATTVEYTDLDATYWTFTKEVYRHSGVVDNSLCPVRIDVVDEGGRFQLLDKKFSSQETFTTIIGAVENSYIDNELVRITRMAAGGGEVVMRPGQTDRLSSLSAYAKHDVLTLHVRATKLVTKAVMCPMASDGHFDHLTIEYKLVPFQLSTGTALDQPLDEDEMTDSLQVKGSILVSGGGTIGTTTKLLLAMPGRAGTVAHSQIPHTGLISSARLVLSVRSGPLNRKDSSYLDVDSDCPVNVEVVTANGERVVIPEPLRLSDSLGHVASLVGKGREDGLTCVFTEGTTSLSNGARLESLQTHILDGKLVLQARCHAPSHFVVSVCPKLQSFEFRAVRWDLARFGALAPGPDGAYSYTGRVRMTTNAGETKATIVTFTLPPTGDVPTVFFNWEFPSYRRPSPRSRWATRLEFSLGDNDDYEFTAEVQHSACTVDVVMVSPRVDGEAGGGTLGAATAVTLGTTVGEVIERLNTVSPNPLRPLITGLYTMNTNIRDLSTIEEILEVIPRSPDSDLDTVEVTATFECDFDRQAVTNRALIGCECRDRTHFGLRCRSTLSLYVCPSPNQFVFGRGYSSQQFDVLVKEAHIYDAEEQGDWELDVHTTDPSYSPSSPPVHNVSRIKKFRMPAYKHRPDQEPIYMVKGGLWGSHERKVTAVTVVVGGRAVGTVPVEESHERCQVELVVTDWPDAGPTPSIAPAGTLEEAGRAALSGEGGELLFKGQVSMWSTVGDVMKMINADRPDGDQVATAVVLTAMGGKLDTAGRGEWVHYESDVNRLPAGFLPSFNGRAYLRVVHHEGEVCVDVVRYKSAHLVTPVCQPAGRALRSYQDLHNRQWPDHPVVFINGDNWRETLPDADLERVVTGAADEPASARTVTAITVSTDRFIKHFTAQGMAPDLLTTLVSLTHSKEMGGSVQELLFQCNQLHAIGKLNEKFDAVLAPYFDATPTGTLCRSDADCALASRIEFCQTERPVTTLFNRRPRCLFAAEVGSISKQTFAMGSEHRSPLEVLEALREAKPPARLEPYDRLQGPAVPFPDQYRFDRDNGMGCEVAAEVLDQSYCGTCWAYATTSATSMRLCKATFGAFNQRVSVGAFTMRSWGLRLGFEDSDSDPTAPTYDAKTNPLAVRFGADGHGGSALAGFESLASDTAHGALPEWCRPFQCTAQNADRAKGLSRVVDAVRIHQMLGRADVLVKNLTEEDKTRVGNPGPADTRRLATGVARAAALWMRRAEKKSTKEAERWATAMFQSPLDVKYRDVCVVESYVPTVALDPVHPVTRFDRLVSQYQESITEVYRELYFNGPMAVPIQMDLDKFFSEPTDGVYSPNKFMPAHNHAVTLVGWGEHPTADGETAKYWIIQNSYGKDWGAGDGGYFRVQRGFDKKCLDAAILMETNGPDRVATPDKGSLERCGMDYLFMLMYSGLTTPSWVPMAPRLSGRSVDGVIKVSYDCKHLAKKSPDADPRPQTTCSNGGGLLGAGTPVGPGGTGPCQCACPAPWSGPQCEQCTLDPARCARSHRLVDPVTCECVCPEGRFGETCGDTLGLGLCSGPGGARKLKILSRGEKSSLGKIGLVDTHGVRLPESGLSVFSFMAAGATGAVVPDQPTGGLGRREYVKGYFTDDQSKDEFGKVRPRVVMVPLEIDPPQCQPKVTFVAKDRTRVVQEAGGFTGDYAGLVFVVPTASMGRTVQELYTEYVQPGVEARGMVLEGWIRDGDLLTGAVAAEYARFTVSDIVASSDWSQVSVSIRLKCDPGRVPPRMMFKPDAYPYFAASSQECEYICVDPTAFGPGCTNTLALAACDTPAGVHVVAAAVELTTTVDGLKLYQFSFGAPIPIPAAVGPATRAGDILLTIPSATYRAIRAVEGVGREGPGGKKTLFPFEQSYSNPPICEQLKNRPGPGAPVPVVTEIEDDSDNETDSDTYSEDTSSTDSSEDPSSTDSSDPSDD